MAKKNSVPNKSANGFNNQSKAKLSAAAPITTPIRNSAIPKVATPAKKEVTQDQIAKRAYEIYASGKGGSELENWCRAERELRGW
jgi:hypothetical protein